MLLTENEAHTPRYSFATECMPLLAQIIPPTAIVPYADDINAKKRGCKLSISRSAIPLHLSYVVTDIFTQGATFKKDEPFLLHFGAERWKAANIRVPITRQVSMDDVHLLAPLGEGMSREKALDRLGKALTPKPAFVREMTHRAAQEAALLSSPMYKDMVDQCRAQDADMRQRGQLPRHASSVQAAWGASARAVYACPVCKESLDGAETEGPTPAQRGEAQRSTKKRGARKLPTNNEGLDARTRRAHAGLERRVLAPGAKVVSAFVHEPLSEGEAASWLTVMDTGCASRRMRRSRLDDVLVSFPHEVQVVLTRKSMQILADQNGWLEDDIMTAGLWMLQVGIPLKPL